ncbi:DNA ligase [Alicyclobacillus fastidiosus]|uniref:DNA ligase (ATP) n=1 Tax=Alicyclobacillus fastidiosus TaxID=392011 RepID=A0ABY6ZKZ9_9BACL|nr:RNA ligase family protein [Alicyclobacillus fastidiosus]WAH42590.1 DNA ligase [Alicyclobacillus fastidiosus]GMA64449.1 hypothetical protein GCM10025859_48890 [Alicyclobacillus fastidiosus]
MQPIIPFEPVRRDAIPTKGDWMPQIKWDGVRMLTYFDRDGVHLFNRKRHERTMQYPELLNIHEYCSGSSAILDGEIIALGADGKPSFHNVMRRDGVRRADRVPLAQQSVAITYMVFDILYLNGEWLTKRPYRERMEMLGKVLQAHPNVQMVTTHDDANALFNVVKEYGMEGIVLKRSDSPYVIGGKSDLWIKVKNYQDLIAVIGGFTLDASNTVNALLLGQYDARGRLWYIGHTGTGKLTKQEWRAMTQWLTPHVTGTRPFVNEPERHRDANWVTIKFTVKIQFAEWTPGGTLRQPSIQAVVDVPAQRCVFDEQAPARP